MDINWGRLPLTRQIQNNTIFSGFLLNLSVGQRLICSFLIAAFIAALLIGNTGLQQIQATEKLSNLYRTLAQANQELENGSHILTLMNIEFHQTIEDARSGLSVETFIEDQKDIGILITNYDSILKHYHTQDILYQHNDLAAVLSEANHAPQIQQQIIMIDSVNRTWLLYKGTQNTILNLLNNNKIDEAVRLERLQGEPTHADALGALHSLINFHEQLTISINDTTHIQERDQVFMTAISALLACICILLAGFLVTQTFVWRLKQLRSIKQSLQEHRLDTRLPVIGRDEIADVTVSVNTMLETMLADAIAFEQQKQINQFKDEFIMNVSHELRTPLTQVFGFLELLIDYHDQLPAEQRLNFLNKAKYGCQELIYLVNSILNATRASNRISPPALKSIDVAQVAHDVIEQLDPRHLREYNIQIHMENQTIVLADQQYLRQILRNLVTNAIKYTPRGTTITITTSKGTPAKEQNEQLPPIHIMVKDTGPGIPPEEIPQLFQRFARLKRDVSGTIRGTGLGLYVCKQLVEAMNGSIWVESSGKAGEGSCFFVALAAGSSNIDIVTCDHTIAAI